MLSVYCIEWFFKLYLSNYIFRKNWWQCNALCFISPGRNGAGMWCRWRHLPSGNCCTIWAILIIHRQIVGRTTIKLLPASPWPLHASPHPAECCTSVAPEDGPAMPLQSESPWGEGWGATAVEITTSGEPHKEL